MKKELIIVGAGLSAGSITADGIEAVRSADVVLYDRLTDEKLLKYAACECINVGKQPYHSNCVKQQDINGLITEHLEMDRRVVRLKGGDSAIFARSLEEAEAARLTGAQVKIIPGVTSASSLTARIEGALTDRRHAHGVMFITGHTKTDELDTVYNWRAIASLGFTIVVYMGVKNMKQIGVKLIENGMNANTAVLIGENLETGSERIMFTTLGEAGRFITENSVSHPATIIIGSVLNLAGTGV